MEDENIVDILKWLFKSETNIDLSGVLTLYSFDEPTKWNVSCIYLYLNVVSQARLKGNLLGMRPVDQAAVEPMLLVCENIKVERSGDHQSFIVRYGDAEMKLGTETEEELFNWMIKVGTYIINSEALYSILDKLLFSPEDTSRIGSVVV